MITVIEEVLYFSCTGIHVNIRTTGEFGDFWIYPHTEFICGVPFLCVLGLF